MFDPAALGTLMIGLESVRKDAEWSEPTNQNNARRSTPSPLRTRLAFALRSAADRLDRTTSGGMGSSRSTA